MKKISILFFVFVCLYWACLINGQAFLFPDTMDYISYADRAIFKVLGVRTSWRDRYLQPVESKPLSLDSKRTGEKSLSSVEKEPEHTGRSIYYGALLYLGHIFGGFWFSVFVQACFVGASVFMTLQALFSHAFERSIIALVALAFLTPLAFFIGFLTPDVFAGITILACVNLIVFSQSLRTRTLLHWLGVLSFAVVVHPSHLLISFGLTVLGLSWLLIKRTSAQHWRGVVVIGTAILISILAEGAFSIAVIKLTGNLPIRVPLMMARVIADGPGYRYLKASCPKSGFIVCSYVDRLPISSETFLWEPDPAIGVYAVSDPATKRALSEEQIQFILASFTYDPVGLLKSSVANWLKQAVTFGLSEFTYSEKHRRFFTESLPEPYFSAMIRTAAYRGTLPTSTLTWLIYGVVIFTVVYLLLVYFQQQLGKVELSTELTLFLRFLLVGIALNAAICGMISGVFDRFQARVIWLLPFLGLILDFYLRHSWWHRIITSDALQTRLAQKGEGNVYGS